MVWILFAKVEEFDLFWMGVLQLISTLIGLVGFTAVTVKLGWFDPYWEGLTKSCTLKVIAVILCTLASLFGHGFTTLFSFPLSLRTKPQ